MNSHSNYPSDQVLIKGCKKGKRELQKALFDKYSSKMFGICLRYSKNYHSAEDLLQEGFIKVFKYISSFRGEGSFEGWMRRIFVHTAIEHYRKQNPLQALNDFESLEPQIINNGALEDLAVKDLLKLINNLSPGYRTVFNLYVIEGYTHKEIGEMLKISEGTSKSQLARARNILQQEVLNHQSSKYEAVVQ